MARRSFSKQKTNPDDLKYISEARTGSPAGLPLGARIRHFREQARMEQKELAERLGVTGNAVSNWENGRSRPDLNLLPALCKALDITLYEVFGMKAPVLSLSEEEQIHLTAYRELDRDYQKAVDSLIDSLLAKQHTANSRRIRTLLYFEKPLAAGTGDPSEFEESAVPFPVYADSVPSRTDYIFSVSGDSMEPVYHDRDLVFVERLDKAGGDTLQPGETGAFISGNECYLKIYREDGLYSFNPSYAPMHFSGSDSVYLIGRVLGTVRKEDIARKEDREGDYG